MMCTLLPARPVNITLPVLLNHIQITMVWSSGTGACLIFPPKTHLFMLYITLICCLFSLYTIIPYILDRMFFFFSMYCVEKDKPSQVDFAYMLDVDSLGFNVKVTL